MPVWLQVITGMALGWSIALISITPAVIADDPWWRIVLHFANIWWLLYWRRMMWMYYTPRKASL